MLKKNIKYIDFDGNEKEEEFYFNLTKGEAAEMELSMEGGLSKTLKNIVASKNPKIIIETFKDLILRSYGEKTPDGRKFIKNQELRDSFAATEAYSELFMELVSDADAAAAFINGILPQITNK